jgi:hypothetical protein
MEPDEVTTPGALEPIPPLETSAAWGDPAPPVEQPACEIKGPYYPIGDVDWECRTHGATAVLVDPSRYGAKDLRRSDFRCSVGAPPVEQP